MAYQMQKKDPEEKDPEGPIWIQKDPAEPSKAK